MAYIDELRMLKARYEQILGPVTRIQGEISAEKGKLEGIKETDRTAYTIDEIGVATRYIEGIISKIGSSNSTACSAIGGINTRIAELASAIAAEEARLAAEAARREEEQRRAAESKK